MIGRRFGFHFEVVVLKFYVIEELVGYFRDLQI